MFKKNTLYYSFEHLNTWQVQPRQPRVWCVHWIPQGLWSPQGLWNLVLWRLSSCTSISAALNWFSSRRMSA